MPNITPIHTLIATLVFLVPLFFVQTSKKERLLISTILSGYSFFLFGWHVHEKALLLVYIPMTLLAFDVSFLIECYGSSQKRDSLDNTKVDRHWFQNIKYLDTFILLSIITPVTQFPLIFTPLEDIVKYFLTISYLILLVCLLRLIYRLPFSQIVSKTNSFFALAIFVLEVYKVHGHQMLFKDSMDFLPLMLTSFICALGVTLSYAQFFSIVFCEGLRIALAKNRCHKLEVTMFFKNKFGVAIQQFLGQNPSKN